MLFDEKSNYRENSVQQIINIVCIESIQFYSIKAKITITLLLKWLLFLNLFFSGNNLQLDGPCSDINVATLNERDPYPKISTPSKSYNLHDNEHI